jgi:hypothetical protein
VRIVIAVALVVEGLSTGVTTVGRLPGLVVYPALTIAIIALRGLVGIVQFVAGWLVLRRQAPGASVGRGVLAASACLVTLELGFGLAPTSLFHTYHWPVVGLYWIYAVIGIVVLGTAR